MKFHVDNEGFLQAGKPQFVPKATTALVRSLRPVEFFTDEELLAVPTGEVFAFDVEVFPNFFYIAFKHLKSGKYVDFEQSPDRTLNATKLMWMLWRYCIVGFNIRAYDLPMIALALRGASNEQLKEASNFLIYGEGRTYAFEKEYGLKVQFYNSIDLIEVAPLTGSLKLYAGRIHAPRLQDLPYPHDHYLEQDEAPVVRLYCCNDLDNTQLLFEELAPEIQLRAEMSEEYGVDLRSKSDAQVAEAVINSELKKLLGYWPKRPQLKEGVVLQYNVPDFIQYQTQTLRDVLEVVRHARFTLDWQGSPEMPRELEKLKVKIGGSTYKLGMGGLHSNEKNAAHTTAGGFIIADNDVESFYPRIILNQRLCPPHLGEAFLTVYESIVNTRIHAKHMVKECKAKGDKDGARKWKVVADSLKITINGSFGKLGNKYSTLYAPQLMLQVTITGQLVLLMLIEMLELAGIDVISGNTDGIVSKYHESRHADVRAIIAQWEQATGFKTEETRYSAIYCRDVNNYIAVKEEGGDETARYFDERMGCKTKGAFCERGSALNSRLSKNPETLICNDAVVAFLRSGTPVEDTVRACRDVRRFVSVRNVKGGAEKNGVYLGKVVRWYYARGENGAIHYVTNGNMVAKTSGGKPLMDLPPELPQDLDYNWYIRTATEYLQHLGYYHKSQTRSLFF